MLLETIRVQRVERLYEHYLANVTAGHGASIEALCSEHGELADELRALHGERTEDLMVEYLGQHSLGEAEHFNAFCADQKAFSGELRALSERMTALGEVLGELSGPGLGEPGTKLGRFQVLSTRGSGSMGEVFRVWDGELRREVALKLLRPVLYASDEERQRARARFLEEAQVTAQLDHPGIVPVHEVGQAADGTLFFIMRLVKGRSLLELLNGEQAPGVESPMACVRLALRAAETLAYAHTKGVLHRDLKPSNIMLGRFGAVYVMDWGLARVLEHAASHASRPGAGMTRVVESVRSAGAAADALRTKPGATLGTPYYMAPEQVDRDAEEPTALVDVYGLGATLYHLLSGTPPYFDTHAEGALQSLLTDIQGRSPTPLGRLAPGLPRGLILLVDRAMARDPARRFSSMQAMGSALGECLEKSGVECPPEPSSTPSDPVEVFENWPSILRRHGLLLALLGAAIFVFGLWMRKVFGA